MKKNIHFISILSCVFLFACASLQQPQGGPKDITPPKVLTELPKNYSRNFKEQKVSITFDEYFKLTNELAEISISPSTEIPPLFKVKQKTLEIIFKDSLEKNTTYAINFGKAIQDVNESNILKNYSYVFATGDKLDSLQISGQVINSSDNKTVKEATVFIFPIEKDTLLGKKKPSIFTTTDSAGNFSLKNLKEGKYTIYGLKETGADRIYNGTNEEIAFLAQPINLKKDTSGITLKLFKEVPEKLRTIDKKIETDGRLTFTFNKPIKSPSLTFIEPKNISQPITVFSSKGDTVYTWLRNYDFDSVKVAINSFDKPLDTLVLRRGKKDTYERTVLFGNNLSAGKITPNQPLRLTFNLPIDSIIKPYVTLLEDSVVKTNFQLNRAEPIKSFSVSYPWLIKKRYTLIFNEGSVLDIYGTKNKSIKLDFELDEVENYGNLSLNMVKADSSKNYILQLLIGENKLFKEVVITNNTILNFNNIPTNKYTLKVIEDANKNGEFDTGNVKLKLQPEKSWFYEKEIITRANWDREEKIIIPKDF